LIVTNQEIRLLEREAERLVLEAGAYKTVELCIEQNYAREGRPRGLSAKALFVGCQLLSFAGDYFLRDVPKVLNGLSADLKKRLGLSSAKPVTSRQVTYLVSRIDAALRADFDKDHLLEAERYKNFDEVFSSIARSGAHEESNNSTSISVDGTDITTWATDKNIHAQFVDPTTGEVGWAKTRKVTDSDAGYRGSKDVDGKASLFGYELTVAVSVKDVNGPDVPRTTLAARFRPVAKSDPRDAALASITEVAMRRGALGDVLVDRGYTQSKHGRDFLTPVRRLGGEPVFDLKENQVGVSHSVRGAVVIDGRPYSPSIPTRFRNIARPSSAGTGVYMPSPLEIKKYEEAIAAREVYSLVPHGKIRENGTMAFQCPGAAGKLICPLQAPFSKAQVGAMPASKPPKKARPNTVCDSRYRSFDIASELPLYQRDVFGSTAWRKSYGRRGTSVEPHFGGLKDEASAAYRRGKVRVRGIIKTGLLVAFALATTNRRLALSWEARKAHAASAPVKRRKERERFHHKLTRIEVRGPLLTLGPDPFTS